MTVGGRIKRRRSELGFSVDYIAEKLGRNRATIYRYESSEIENFPISIIEPLASVLQTTPSYLMGWDDDSKPIKNPDNTRSVPLIGTIAAGYPILAEQNIEEYFNIDSSVKADFALRVKGDSMINAGIQEEDIAFIRKQATLENGEIGAILVEDEATLKKLYMQDDKVILQSENNAYKPMIYSSGELKILGKMVAVLSMK